MADYTIDNSILQKGSKILQTNKFFADLTQLMKNIEFKKLYTEYFY